jgi:large subunit ribosomal protein L18
MLVDVSFKKEGRKKRHRSLRKRIEGTSERPRLAVFRSARHIYAQVIDDVHKKTLTAVSDKALALGPGKEGEKQPNKKARAKKVGAAIAKQCLEKGIDKVVFDRAGYKYHGRVSALADGAREAGLKF